MLAIYNFITFIAFILSLIWLYAQPGYEPLVSSVLSLAATIGLFIKYRKSNHTDDVTLSLESSNNLNKYWRHLRFSFTRDEYVHPKIIQELQGVISDLGEQVVGINLIDSNSSNRFFGEVDINKNDNTPLVICKEEKSSFGYLYIGTSPSGIHILRTFDWGGGSGVFHNLILLTLEEDTGLIYSDGKLNKKERIIIKTLGSISLGDRYEGEIKYENKILSIEKDHKKFGEAVIKNNMKLKIT